MHKRKVTTFSFINSMKMVKTYFVELFTLRQVSNFVITDPINKQTIRKGISDLKLIFANIVLMDNNYNYCIMKHE